MKTQISKIKELKENRSTAFIIDDLGQIPANFLTPSEKEYLLNKIAKNEDATIFRYPELFFFHKLDEAGTPAKKAQELRKAGAKLFSILKQENIGSIQVGNLIPVETTIAFAEGILLASYSFSKYKKDKGAYLLTEIGVNDEKVPGEKINELSVLADAVFFARDMVNEPLIYLTAVDFAERIKEAGTQAGFSVEVFGKQKIVSLKMGGLLAVNRGSIDPPTFTVAEWKPKNCINKQPIVLIGKGVVYDTGGLSLKPTLNSMDEMKSDMGGGAAVAATIYALAKLNVPLHVVGLIPATDNRPDGNAITPGDIITISDGTTVEIKNTDAEGRLLLADALTYAKKYNPMLVIDVATLTGSAAMISGYEGIVGMGNTPEYLSRAKQVGDEVYERVIELPLWDEFRESLKSPVADLTNVGSREGQAIIAGKFLEHFTSYPWIHLDIAGPAFIKEDKDYRPMGGTGVGVRLLFHFLKNI
jgi:leucyl aminopeptidase